MIHLGEVIVVRHGRFAMLGLAVALAACGSDGGGSSASSTGAAKSKQQVLGMSFCYLDNAGMITYRDAETATAKKLGWKVLQPTNANRDQAKQLTDIDALMNQGATALDIHQCTADGVVPAIKKANTRKIPVFIPDQAVAGGDVTVTVQVDSVEMARKDCEQFLQILQERHGSLDGKVVQLQGDIGSQAGADRTKGFEECMKEKAPNIKILTVPTKWEGPVGAAGLDTLLNANKDVHGVFMQSDIVFSTAVGQLLKRRNLIKPPTDPAHLILFGIDGGCDMLKLIRSGTADFTISSPLNAYGPAGIPFLQRALEGKLGDVKAGSKSTLPGSEGYPINQISTGLQVLVPSELTNKDNADDPQQWANTQGCTGQ
jgi:ribose transport system substrate-binding protein